MAHYITRIVEFLYLSKMCGPLVLSAATLSITQLRAAHNFILNNCDEVDVFKGKHLEELKRLRTHDIEKSHDEQFSSWFRDHINYLHHKHPDQGSEALWTLANGPQSYLTKSYSGCFVNGVRFHSKSREENRNMQNSGLAVEGDYKGQMIDFYGFVTNVVELMFLHDHKVVLFQCEWYNTGSTTYIWKDKHFVSLDIRQRWYKNDPFVLPNQVQQVFYLPDTKFGDNWRIVQRVHHMHLCELQEIEESAGDDTFEDDVGQHDSNGAVNVDDDDIGITYLAREDIEPDIVSEEMLIQLGQPDLDDPDEGTMPPKTSILHRPPTRSVVVVAPSPARNTRSQKSVILAPANVLKNIPQPRTHLTKGVTSTKRAASEIAMKKNGKRTKSSVSKSLAFTVGEATHNFNAIAETATNQLTLVSSGTTPTIQLKSLDLQCAIPPSSSSIIRPRHPQSSGTSFTTEMENEDEEDFPEDEEALVDEEEALDDDVNPDEDALTEGEQELDEDDVDSQQPTAVVKKTLRSASSGKELENAIVEHGVTISRDGKKVLEIEFRKNEKVPWEFARHFANGVWIIVRQNDKLDFKTTWKHVPDEVKQPIYAELDLSSLHKWFTIVAWPRNPIVHAKVYDYFYDAYRHYKGRLHRYYQKMIARGKEPKSKPMDEWISEEKLEKLYEYFASPEFLKRSRANKENISKMLYSHTSGLITFTERLYKLPNKSEVDNFGATHMTKAGAYINDEAAKKHAEMRNRKDQAKAAGI